MDHISGSGLLIHHPRLLGIGIAVPSLLLCAVVHRLLLVPPTHCKAHAAILHHLWCVPRLVPPIWIVSLHGIASVVLHHGGHHHHDARLCHCLHRICLGLPLHRVASESVCDTCLLHITHLSDQVLLLLLRDGSGCKLLLHESNKTFILGDRILPVIVGLKVCKHLIVGLLRVRLLIIVAFVDHRTDRE